MKLSAAQLWDRFQRFYFEFPSIGLGLDISRMSFDDDFLPRMEPALKMAWASMTELEKGGIANKDEKRMVGHYWLRSPHLAPDPKITKDIEDTLEAVESFSAEIHQGKIRAYDGTFTDALIIGIGGSALGPQFVASALGNPKTDRMRMHFLDNTDPDGIDRVLTTIGERLKTTLAVVISKSGGTKETRNGMLEAKAAFANAGLEFSNQAVAITGPGSGLDQTAQSEGWLCRFPMWDWVGGRTSETSVVGLLPAALQGLKIRQMLTGAKSCDEITRQTSIASNPAAQLALMWYWAGKGKGAKDMVIIPYKDRLELFSKYLQQLVMESLGKRLDIDGKEVNQGIAVYGNKGSTDQHAYVQQLRDGINNFFVTFIRVIQDRGTRSITVEGNATSGDYLDGFLLGTRKALFENGRDSITLTINEVSEFSIGVLIALYERAVGLYASLINVNAYHQPGVEAGKKAAEDILKLQREVLLFLETHPGVDRNADEIAKEIGASEQVESVFLVCAHLAANPDRGILKSPGTPPAKAQFKRV